MELSGDLCLFTSPKKALDRLQISSEVSGKYELTLLTERLTISLKMSVLEVNLMQGGTFGKYIE